ncbi:MAG: nucleotide exchange factor GrpE [Eubacteriales bacterium]|nr:nucleotide exchange factor GrpE [Eubacteriales bacterium]
MEKEQDIENFEENTKETNENLEETSSENQEEKIEKSEIDILKENLENAEKTSKDYLDRLQRTMAEFDNFRKRTNAEKTSMFENGTISAIEKLLPILDNFERAISSTSDEDKESPIFKGVDMIYKQMQEAFSNMGVEELEGIGAEFNPNLHNAVLHIEDENLGENVIAEVLQKGYKYKDKVIRPSMVKVAN